MNHELYDKYGEHNKDGYYIIDHEKWHFFAQRPRLYNRKKRYANLSMLIPIVGIILNSMYFEEMGLSTF